MAQIPDWMDELFAWADENKILPERLPRNKTDLFNKKELDFSKYEITSLPESISLLTHVTSLNLNNNKLKELPEFIGNFTNLVRLDLNNSRLAEFPYFIKRLKNLSSLCLAGNNITNIPPFLCELTSLTKLVLNNNKISGLPLYLGKLKQLKELDLTNNVITVIPEVLGDLVNLTSLCLSGNKITAIPLSFAKLQLVRLDINDADFSVIPEVVLSISTLRSLSLASNKIKEIPESICNLTNLTNLYLSENQLVEIPTFLGLTKLNVLGLSGNSLRELPCSIKNLISLTKLSVANNKLTKLTKEISELKKLEGLALHDNYLTKIPEEILIMPNLKIIGFDNQLPQPTPKTKMKTYQQKILFGSPGTGKSYQIDKHIIPYELLIDVEKMPANVIKTVFHPEYTYGDFVGKLMPITVGGNVQYKFYEGHFLKALSQAYKNIIAAQDNDGEIEKVALVIDEINRGNSAAIFGTIFQLLDREPDGWSSYEVSVNEIIFNRLFELCDLKESLKKQGKVISYKFGDEEIEASELQKKLNCHFENRTIKIPPNLSILASMNTSDSSIYYMDSAFKRRWEWEFIDVDSNTVSADGVAFENRVEWQAFVSKLNAFIKSNHKSIRGIEDKQIGHFFITDDVIQKSSIQNKLMFFLWDSVFNRDKKPLIDLLFGKDTKHDELPLITFGDFATQVDLFIEKIDNFKNV